MKARIRAWPGAPSRAGCSVPRRPPSSGIRHRRRSRFRTCASPRAGEGGHDRPAGGRRLGWKVYDTDLKRARSGWKVRRGDRPARRARPSLVQDWILPLREEQYAPPRRPISTHLAKLSRRLGARPLRDRRPRRHLYYASGRRRSPSGSSLPSRRGRYGFRQRWRSVRTAVRDARDLDRRRLQF